MPRPRVMPRPQTTWKFRKLLVTFGISRSRGTNTAQNIPRLLQEAAAGDVGGTPGWFHLSL